MALSRNKIEEIPKDAVRLTEEEALKYQWKIISGWEKLSEVWALRYSAGILAGLAAGTGIFVNNYYRRKLKLGSYGHLSTYLPIVAVPAMFSVLAHKTFVQREILINPLKNCPLCIQLRAASFQAAVGVIYPTILAPIAAFMFATRYFTYRLPSVTEKPFEVLQLWTKMTRPVVGTLGTFVAFHALMGMWITSQELKQSYFVLMKMKQIEEETELQVSEIDKTRHIF